MRLRNTEVVKTRMRNMPLKTSGPVNERDQHTLYIGAGGAVGSCSVYGNYLDIDAFSVDIVANGQMTYGNGAGVTVDHSLSGYSDSDANLKFSPSATNPGEWYILNGAAGAFQNDNRNQNQQKLFYRFISNQPTAAIIYTKASNRGTLELTIDGVSKAIINQYAGSTQRQRIKKFENLNVSLPAGVVIDTHIIHGYIRGENVGGSDTYADIDRVDPVKYPTWPGLFNTMRTGLNSNKGVRADISTADPVLRVGADPNGDWSYSRVFVQRLNNGSPNGWCEVGHLKDNALGHRGRWVVRQPGAPASQFQDFNPVLFLSVGTTYSYSVEIASNFCAFSVFASGSLIAYTNQFSGLEPADTWGAGAETASPVHGIGPTQVYQVQYRSPTSLNWVSGACPNRILRDVSFYDATLNGTCDTLTLTGNDF